MSEFAMGDFDWSTTGVPRLSRHAAGEAEGSRDVSPAASTRRARAARGIGILVATLGAAMLAAAAFLLLPSGLKVSRYEVSGAASMGHDEVLAAALVHGNEYFFSLDPARMERALLAEPRIASAKVVKVFPNRVKIEIAERLPVAYVLVEGEAGLVPVCLDGQAYAFAFAGDYFNRLSIAAAKAAGVASATGDASATGAAGPARDGIDTDLPVISGLRFEGFRLGARLPLECRASIASIAAIEAKNPVLLKAFSEIKIVKPRYGEPELVLYPVHCRMPVRTGAVLNESTLRSIILVLDILESRGLDSISAVGGTGGEIDFRSGTVVYRAKGGQSD
jgi:cell division protein FtsQ